MTVTPASGESRSPLPSHVYFDPAHYQLELEAIWYRTGIYLCRAASLEGPRSYRTFDLGSQQILLLRDEAGILRAFHNTCRHRGSRLCRAEAGRFEAKRIVCPYHRWAYSLQGTLLRTSSLALPEGFDKADLPALRRGRRRVGRLRLCQSGGRRGGFRRRGLRPSAATPRPLASGRPDGRPRIPNCPPMQLEGILGQFQRVSALPGVHPELSSLVPIHGRGLIGERDDPRWREHESSDDPRYKGWLRPGAATWSMDGQALDVRFQGLSEAERRAGRTYVTSLPSLFVVGHIDYVRAVRLLPLDPERTELVAEWAVSPQTMGDPAFDPANVVEFATLVMEQDAEACELNQRGLRSLRHETGVLMPEEYYVKWFHDWVRAQLATWTPA